TFTELTSSPSHPPAPFTDQLRLAVAAYLARFKGSSREHTESDLRCFLAWCAEHGLDPLTARRPHWSCTSGRCKGSAGSSLPRCRGGSQSRPGSTGPAASTACWSTHRLSTSAVPRSLPNHRPSGSPTCSSRP